MINWGNIDEIINQVINQGNYFDFMKSYSEQDRAQILRHLEENRGDISGNVFKLFESAAIEARKIEQVPIVRNDLIFEKEADRAAKEAINKANYKNDLIRNGLMLESPAIKPKIKPTEILTGLRRDFQNLQQNKETVQPIEMPIKQSNNNMYIYIAAIVILIAILYK